MRRLLVALVFFLGFCSAGSTTVQESEAIDRQTISRALLMNPLTAPTGFALEYCSEIGCTVGFNLGCGVGPQGSVLQQKTDGQVGPAAKWFTP